MPSSRCRGGSRPERLDLPAARPFRPLARRRLPDRRRRQSRPGSAHARPACSPCAQSTSRGRRRRWRLRCAARSPRHEERACSRSISARRCGPCRRFRRLRARASTGHIPHTLRVVVVPERAVAVVRQGADAYLVAESGRVIARVERRDRPALARIWVNHSVDLRLGVPHRGRSADGGCGGGPARRLALPGARQLRHGDAGLR